MNKTKDDDIIKIVLKSITPKLKEMEKKLENGENLNNEEVQFLLLCAIQSKFDDRFKVIIENLIFFYKQGKLQT